MNASTLTRQANLVEPTDDINRRGLLRTSLGMGAMALGVPLLSSCGNDPKTGATAAPKPPTKPTGALRVASHGEPLSLDPSIAGTYFDFGILAHNVYENLVAFRARRLSWKAFLQQASSLRPTPASGCFA